MICIIEKKIKLWKIAVFITVIAVWSVGIVAAEESIQILSIKPVPDLTVDDNSTLEDKTDVFHESGVVDRIGMSEEGKTEIVIGDRLKYLAPSTNYYSREGNLISLTYFHVGSNVGYLVNSAGEITDLYLLDK
ncbi:MAG: hypothetical protein HQK62_03745 [Desulfamplus sp.]|nr:hypothetical protein [Desulfamplus sp.]